MKIKILGAFLLIAALAIVVTIFYRNSQKRHVPVVFSPKDMLTALWETYKKSYWDEQTGRTIDRQRNNVTTSEGQSYTMLRAVWQDDKPTFDKSWSWTQSNLKRQEDNLFSWLYGPGPDGQYQILTDQGGHNSATDADSDIALALTFAYSRWKDPEYLRQAKNIIQDIWDHEVVTIQGEPYLTSNNVEKNSPDFVLLNPSYYSPYAYRIFAAIDPEHDWDGVVASSYKIVNESAQASLDKQNSSGMPPDWVTINRNTGQLRTSQQEGLTTNYSYDALRLPWRLALDYQWNKSSDASTALMNMHFLRNEWDAQRALYASYSHDGKILSQTEAPAMYGGTIGYFLVADPGQAQAVYDQKLRSLYNPDIESWRKPLSYYDDNWTWFGLALYHNLLPNLAQDLTVQTASSSTNNQ